MYTEDKNDLFEPCPLTSVVWRGILFFSLLFLLLYVGIVWPI